MDSANAVYAFDKHPKNSREEYYIPNDLLSGMASVPFPTLASGHLDSGTLCFGCKWLSREWFDMDSEELKTALGGFVRDTNEVEDICMELRNRAWIREKFSEHLETCYGTKQMVRSSS